MQANSESKKQWKHLLKLLWKFNNYLNFLSIKNQTNFVSCVVLLSLRRNKTLTDYILWTLSVKSYPLVFRENMFKIKYTFICLKIFQKSDKYM